MFASYSSNKTSVIVLVVIYILVIVIVIYTIRTYNRLSVYRTHFWWQYFNIIPLKTITQFCGASKRIQVGNYMCVARWHGFMAWHRRHHLHHGPLVPKELSQDGGSWQRGIVPHCSLSGSMCPALCKLLHCIYFYFLTLAIYD